MSTFTVIVTYPIYNKEDNSFTLGKDVNVFYTLQDAYDYISSLDYPPHKISIHFNIH